MALEALLIYYIYEEYLLDESPDLSPEDRRRRDRRTPRIAVKRYSESPFHYLYGSGDEQSLLNCCAVDHATFQELLHLFEPAYNLYTVDKDTGAIRMKKSDFLGRERSLNAAGALGLVLYWYRTRGSCARAIAWVFGLTATPMYQWLKFSRRILLSVLQHHPEAKVLPPTIEEVHEFADAISAKYPILKDKLVWGAIDGLKLELQQATSWHVQAMYYNGWKDDTFVNSVFVFGANGKIKICMINAPGTMHDSQIADYGLYNEMEAVFDATDQGNNKGGGRVVVDQAFRLSSKDYLLKSTKDPEDNRLNEENYIEIHQAACSVRQLAEHGMRAIQGSFPRMKDRVQFDSHNPHDRRVTLHLMVLLYNYQTAKVGINQILNTFMSETEGFVSYAYRDNGDRQRVTLTADNQFN